MLWYKVKWIPGLFAAVDAVFPNRGHAQDGTVGDLAHLTGTSGHNPDDTPGVTAERQDADTRPEVRAADVDTQGVDGDAVVAAVLGDASALRLLIYIIWNRHIWRASNGWQREAYNGSDPHDRHMHFSGHPDADEVAFTWDCIRNMYKTEDEDMAGSFGPTQLEPTGTTTLTIPPVQAGTADPRQTWINIGSDCGGANPDLRIWQTNGDGNWKPLPGHGEDGRVKLANGVVFSQELDKGVRILSVSRMDDWAGSISVAFERK
jgi:hypothetical protein